MHAAHIHKSILNQIALLGLTGQAAALGSQIQSVGDCGNTAGACITVTPVDNNPKGRELH
jgi:hypothetical protein